MSEEIAGERASVSRAPGQVAGRAVMLARTEGRKQEVMLPPD
ncbi:hypothetical protein ACFWB2_43060 [Streptomyces virginiae]